MCTRRSGLCRATPAICLNGWEKAPMIDLEEWAFGSSVRAQAAAGKYSDLDLAVIAGEGIGWMRIVELKPAMSESDLPITVDILDYNAVSDGFREVIARNHEVVCGSRSGPPRRRRHRRRRGSVYKGYTKDWVKSSAGSPPASGRNARRCGRLNEPYIQPFPERLRHFPQRGE